MMMLFIGVITVISIFINLAQLQKRSQQKKNLTYIYQKLKQILDGKTEEKLLLYTDDDRLKQILIEINRLLEHNQKMIADYNKTESSMRKMLSNISHDLKTPLTVVLGYLEILMDESESNKEELLKIHSKAEEVLDLIKRFFDLVKLESGDKNLPLTKVNINEICKKNILGYYGILTSKGFEVVIEIPDENLYVLGNDEALGRVLNNLISNAIQYGEDGKVLGIRLQNNDKCVLVDVWDKGKGINALYQDSVFERMYTLEDSRNKLYQGSGLGLTITKRLVEKMGGEIHLKSVPFEKTTFTVKLNRLTF